MPNLNNPIQSHGIDYNVIQINGKRLSNEAYLTEGEAISVFHDYIDGNDIDICTLNANDIRLFIDVVQHAPNDIETEEIARFCHIERPQQATLRWSTLADGIVRTDTREAPRPEPLSVPFVDFSNAGDIIASNEARSSSVNPFEYYATSSPSRPKAKKKPRRSELDMMREIVRESTFPRPSFKDWSDRNEMENIINDWYRNVEYREQWIFSRREREGFNRRNVGYFNLDDVLARISKRKKPHELDSSFSKFYDWRLGGTEWMLRLELFEYEDKHFLIIRHIHRPTNTEMKFDVRYWNGQMFKQINYLWTELKNNPEIFEMVFGSNDESSSYYVRPYVEEEDDCEEDSECESCYMDTDEEILEDIEWDSN